MTKVTFDRSFKRNYGKLIKKNPTFKPRVLSQIKKFQKDPLHPGLHSHKVNIDGLGCFSFRVTGDIRILAIGGGEIGRPGTIVETRRIDEEIRNLTQKDKPKMIFLPTASGDSKGYVEVVQNYFGKKLGFRVTPLYLIDKSQRTSDFQELILNIDVVYVGGGNTLKMLQIWRKLEIDKLLFQASEKGLVLSGVSAGGICWGKYALSDSRKYGNGPNKDKLMRIKGLGFVNISIAPHQIREPYRLYEMMEMIKRSSGRGLVLEDCAALEVAGDKWRIISSKRDAGAYMVYKKRGQINCKRINASKEFFPFKDF